MKKVSLYILLSALAGLLFVGTWAWQKYAREAPPRLLLFRVERGDISDMVKARGEVAAIKDVRLEFPFSGIVARVFVNEGVLVETNAPLIKLQTTDVEIELRRLTAGIAQQKANLEKLRAGPTAQDIQVLETKVANAAVALGDAEKNFLDKLQDAYTKSDDAVRNSADQFFNNPRSSDPQLNILVSEQLLEAAIESDRVTLEPLFSAWQASLSRLAAGSELGSANVDAQTKLRRVKAFLDNVALAVNALQPTAALSRTVVDGYRAAVASARANVNTAVVNLTAAEEKWRAAGASKTLAERELALKKAGTRQEDITIAEAQIAEAEWQAEAAREKIKKSTLYAPLRAKVTDIAVEEGEVFNPGAFAAALSSPDHEVQADISELDIGRIAAGTPVTLNFDAYPGTPFSGTVERIDEQPVIKEGDTYYRVHIRFADGADKLRLGMRADASIIIARKSAVLKVPRIAVRDMNGKAVVAFSDAGMLRDVEVRTGASDGASVEIVSGLEEGQTVAVVGTAL